MFYMVRQNVDSNVFVEFFFKAVVIFIACKFWYSILQIPFGQAAQEIKRLQRF